MNYNSTFLKIWFASLITTIGTFLFLLGLVSETYERTQSVFLSGFVFPSQWLLASILFLQIGKWVSKGEPNRQFLKAEIWGALFTLLIGLVYEQSFFFVFLFLAMRGIFDASTKSLRTIALKRFFSGIELKKYSSLINSSYLLGTGLGALIGSFLIQYMSVLELAILDVLTFLLAGLVFYTVGNCPVESKPLKAPDLHCLRGLLARPQIFNLFFYVVLLVATFQGYHNLARGPLPEMTFDDVKLGILFYQITFCVGITLATYIAKKYFLHTSYKQTFHMFFTCLASLIFIAYVENVYLSFVLYFTMALIFEIIFVVIYREVIESVSQEEIGLASILLPTLACLFMAITVLVFGNIFDLVGFQTGTFILIIASVLTFGLWVLLKKGQKLEPHSIH